MTQGINFPRLDNLPTLLSTFIGREHEIASLKQLLLQNRLVTLTGVGGSGKTRLAIKLANEVRDKFEQGTWFIEFAPLADDTLVSQVVATTLGIREQKNSPLIDDLIERLQNQQSLLIFDNCEHLINACAQLVEKLLIACPGLRILITSREPLSIPSEVVWVVPSMSLPEQQPWRDPTSGQSALLAYQKSEAVQLFLNRAALVVPDFKLTIENSTWVAEKKKVPNLKILFKGDKMLVNTYHALVQPPGATPGAATAAKFIAFVASPGRPIRCGGQ